MLGLASAALAGLPGRASAHGADADRPKPLVPAQESVPFWGPHQAGIVTPRPCAGLMAAFHVLAEDRAELERLLRTLSARIAFLTQGGPQTDPDPLLPPAGSGLLGPVVRPDALTITVSVGASLFDERFGLAAHRPRHLQPMQAHPNDALDAALCHGDVSIQLCAHTPDTVLHALRDLLKHLPDLLLLHWKQEGSVAPTAATAPTESARNFLGFRDGSANPDAADAQAMQRIVWVAPDSGEPAWAVGGSYQAVRIIRNFVERWDRTPLREQEAIMGRRKASGAPLDADHSHGEQAVPDYTRDPEGQATPLDAHIRLANPRTPASAANLMLRRPYNYSNGLSRSGQLDMGLLFICYQADLEKGFLTVQRRLDGEPLEEYIKPVGGGIFFTLPGMHEPSDWLGRALLQA